MEMIGNINDLIDHINTHSYDLSEDSLDYLESLLTDARESMVELLDQDILDNYGVLYGVLSNDTKRDSISGKGEI